MRRSLALVITGLILASWVAYVFTSRDHKPTAIPPLATGNFSDGSSVVIEQVAFANELVHTGLNPPGFIQFAKTTDSATHSFGEHRLRRDILNGQLDAVHFQTDHPALLVQLTARRPDGTAEWDSLVTGRHSLELKEVFHKIDGSIDRAEKVPEDTERLLKVEISDGDNGWRTMYQGALLFPGRGSHVVYVPEFPRDSPMLTLRVTRSGETVELTIPNPDQRSSPEPWKPAPIPHDINLDEFAVRLEGVTWETYLGRPHLIANIKIVTEDGGQPEGAAYLRYGHWESEWGDTAESLFPLPGTRLAKYHGQLRRDWRYSFPRDVCTVIATATWPDDGSLPTFTPSAQGTAWGIASVTMTPAVGHLFGMPMDWEQVTITIEGESTVFDGPPELYDLGGTFFAPFIDGSERSAGSAELQGRNRTETMGGTKIFSHRAAWTLRSFADISPGTKIEIALPPQRDRWDFEFIVELPKDKPPTTP